MQKLKAALVETTAELRRVARFSHAKDFSHHGVDFDACDKSSCVDARAAIERAEGT